MRRSIDSLVRPLIVALTLVLALAAPVHAQSTDLTVAMAERALGNANAPVTILEFASFTCPHCARFHREMLPRIRSEFIDTGKARLVFVDLPNDGLALRAGMLAHCTPPDRYFTLAQTLFETQATWIQSSDQVKALSQVAKLTGMAEPQIQACLADSKLQDALLERRLQAAQQWKLTGTPTFIVGKGALDDATNRGATHRVEGLNEAALVDALKKLTAIPAR